MYLFIKIVFLIVLIKFLKMLYFNYFSQLAKKNNTSTSIHDFNKDIQDADFEELD